MPFIEPQIAALPELCLLGKNTTWNYWSKWLWAKSHSCIYFNAFFNEILDTKVWPSKIEGTENAITRRSIRNKRRVAGTREEEEG